MIMTSREADPVMLEVIRSSRGVSVFMRQDNFKKHFKNLADKQRG
jgi:hypothetical protein